MPLLPSDEHFLRRAVELARDAAAFASPNPTVGCVLARNSEVIGEGAHFYDYYDHAEIAALKQAQAAGHSIAGATAYVTLEPCAHHGRTGPCSVALTSAGIARCVTATVDPNPQVSGKGILILRDGGITVDVLNSSSPLALEARRLNDAFAFSIQHGRPFVTLKAAVSIDGYLAPSPSMRTGNQPHWLTGEAARDDVQQLRHLSDAILTGVGTVLADDPSLTDRTGLLRRRPLLRVVLDSQLRTPIQSKLLDSAAHDVLILSSGSAPMIAAEALKARGTEVVRIVSSHDRVDLPVALQILHGHNVRSVLLEAGSSLNASFLASGLVDKVVLYYSDTELGQSSIPFAGFTTTPYELQQSLTRVDRKSFLRSAELSREDVRVSGYLHDPWANVPSIH